jgi:CBS domain-containing protein
MKVSDVMTPSVRTISIRSTLNEALVEMWGGDVGALPVLDDDGVAIGVLTDRDAAMAVFLQAKLPAQIPVRSVLSGQVWAADPDDPIATTEEVLRTRQVRRLPVTDPQGRLVGMVTLTDLPRAASGGAWAGAAGRLARTIASIGRPRTTAPPAPPSPDKFAGG